MKSNWGDVALYGVWLEEKRNLAESTIVEYTSLIKEFITRNPDIDSLDDYNNFLVEKTYKKRRGSLTYSALRAFIEFKTMPSEVKKRILEGFIKLKTPKNSIVNRRHLSEEETMELINNIRLTKHKIIALIQMLTGVRAGDIMRLKRDNIYPEEYNGQPTLRLNITGKGEKRNVVFIHDEIAQKIITDYITNTQGIRDFYFLEEPRNFIGIQTDYRLYRTNYNLYWKDMKQAMELCGIRREDFATHDLRRGFARRVWEKYKDIIVLQRMLNHADPKNTIRYLEKSGLQNVDYYYDMQK